jgi:hypothetical protein
LNVNIPDVVVLGAVETPGVVVVVVDVAGAAGEDGELEPQAAEASTHNATQVRRKR